MSTEKILSISVAAYNLEKLIKQNLDSFINSSVNELIEVIVTDDGSKDSTAKIVKEYADKYPGTIRLIEQENAGPGSTVNSGIKHATGKYFKMIDGDDWVNTDSLNTIIDKLKNIDVDMVITNYEIFDDSKQKVIETVRIDLESNKILNFKNICRNLHLDMHNVMFRTAILKENEITIDNGFYTDIEYLLLPCIYVSNTMYIDVDFYIYRVAQATQSVSIPSMQKNIKMHDLVLNRLIDFYVNDCVNLEENVKEYISNRLAIMSNTQLGTLLTFPVSKENKKNIMRFVYELNQKSSDIYNKFKKSKRAKLLINTKYLLYGIIAKMYTNKISK